VGISGFLLGGVAAWLEDGLGFAGQFGIHDQLPSDEADISTTAFYRRHP
jgi:hypothetical protein